MPWKTFLQAPWEGLTACDLFTVEVLTLAGLQRYLVFFVIALPSRRVTIAGIHPQPYGTWMGANGPQFNGPSRWLLATRPLSDARPRPARHAGFWRDPRGAGVSSRSVSRRRVPISTRMPSGSSAL